VGKLWLNQGKIYRQTNGRRERLIADIGEKSEKIDAIKKSTDRIRGRTGRIVIGILLSAVAALSWWALGDQITAAVYRGLYVVPTGNTSKTSPAVTPLPASPPPSQR
jgi:hypothetical protein